MAFFSEVMPEMYVRIDDGQVGVEGWFRRGARKPLIVGAMNATEG